MIDINLIRTNPDLVKENIKKKFQDKKLPLVDEVAQLDAKRRALIAEGRLPAEAAPSLILPGIGVAAVGFAMVAAGVLTASTLYVGQYREAGLCGAVCLGTGAVFKLIFNRYISRLTVNQEP